MKRVFAPILLLLSLANYWGRDRGHYSFCS